MRVSYLRLAATTISQKACQSLLSTNSCSEPLNRAVIERIRYLKAVTVEVKAGKATRRDPAVKACGPNDLVFSSIRKGAPMRDNNILVRHIKPAARKLGLD